MMAGILVASAAALSFAEDSLLFINAINVDDANSKSIGVEVSLDGKKLCPDYGCGLEHAVHVVATGAVAPGAHSVAVKVEGGKTLTKKIVIRDKDAATNWDLVPKDTRLWCVIVKKTSLKLASKGDCWKIEQAR
jgi:hypothetical protein